MKTFSRPRRRRVAGFTSIRTLGWLTAASMVALATLGPAAGTSLAAKPDVPGQNGNGQGNDQNGGGAGDNACNNVLNGAPSPDFVWVSADAAGVTVYWATDEDHFGSDGTVVVRACVVIGDVELGAIVQNTTNDGSEAFAWSAFGLDSDPCVANEVQVAGSVDGGNPFVDTKKSAVITCSHPADEPPADEENPPTGDEQPPADEPPADEPPADDQATPPADEENPPADEEQTTPPVDDEQTGQPVAEVQPTTETTSQPTQQPVVEPSVAPTETPTGAVLGAVGAPSITPPPTDTLGTAPVTTTEAWRLVLLGLAFLLAALLLAMPDDRTARRRA